MKEMIARDLAVLLAETEEAIAFYERCDKDDLYEMLEANGYSWFEGGWYTEETITEITNRQRPKAAKPQPRITETIEQRLAAFQQGIAIKG